MLKRFTWILALMAIAVCAHAIHIDYIPNPDGGDIALRDQQDVYYHNERDDQHWYGTNRWAVYFDLLSYFPGSDTVSIIPTEAVFFCPSNLDGDTVTLTVCGNNDSDQPDETNIYAIATEEGNLYGWNTIDLDGITESLYDFWIIIDYETHHYSSSPEQSSYIAASGTGGTHSYYWDPDYGSNGWFLNMSLSGFESEFIIGVNGDFVYPEEYRDIRLDSVGANVISGNHTNIYPTWQITNRSAVTLEDVTVTYSIEPPDDLPNGGFTATSDPFSIDAGETITGIADSCLTLGRPKLQMIIEAEVSYPGSDELDASQSNNSGTHLQEIFLTARSHAFIENAVRSEDPATSMIWELQDSEIDPETSIILNYFPDMSDTLLYCQDAVSRFSQYELFGYPNTIVQGLNKINGYSGEETYVDSLQRYHDNTLATNTFVSLDGYDIRTWEDGEYLCRIYLTNDSTYVFDSYIQNLVFYAALVEEGITVGDMTIPGYTLIEFLPDSTGVVGVQNDELLCDSTATYNFDFNINNIEAIQDTSNHFENLSVLMFLQFESESWNRKSWIEYATVVPLSSFIDEAVGVDDETAPVVPDVSVYPNPFRPGQNVYIELPQTKSRSLKQVTVDVYNIRGQRVRRIVREQDEIASGIYWDGRNQQGRIVSTGIYLMRIEANDGNSASVLHKNCLLIK